MVKENKKKENNNDRKSEFVSDYCVLSLTYFVMNLGKITYSGMVVTCIVIL